MITISKVLNYLDENMIQYTFIGDSATTLHGFSSLKNYKSGTITWIKEDKSIPKEFDPKIITLAFVQEGIFVHAQNQIIMKVSKQAFFSTIEHFFVVPDDRPPVGHGTYISPDVKLGQNVKIGHNCVLDGEIKIGDNACIWDNVSIINKVVIGCGCNIQSGTRIGHDGFGYTEDLNHKKTMIKHYGGVQIGDNVYIGPNCVIDRGTIDDTCIGDGTKIDALCFIAHNVRLGENVTLIAGSLPYGSVVIGDNSYIATSIIKNQCVIGNNAVIGMGSVVIRDVEDNTTVVGNPANPLKK